MYQRWKGDLSSHKQMQKLIGTLKFLTNLCKSSLLSKFIYTRTNTVQNHLLPENVCICDGKAKLMKHFVINQYSSIKKNLWKVWNVNTWIILKYCINSMFSFLSRSSYLVMNFTFFSILCLIFDGFARVNDFARVLWYVCSIVLYEMRNQVPVIWN